MSDGLNITITDEPLSYFRLSDSGLYFTVPEAVDLSITERRVHGWLNAKIGVYAKANRKSSAVELEAKNPSGNTKVVSAGWDLFGPPIVGRTKNEGRTGMPDPITQEQQEALDVRFMKIMNYQRDFNMFIQSLETAGYTNEAEHASLIFEKMQSTTGLSFDGNEFGDITKSALNSVVEGLKATQDLGLEENPELQAMIVEEIDEVGRQLIDLGIQPGSLEPTGATLMRANQEHDGIFAVPVWENGFDPLDKDMAKALLIWTNGKASLGHLVGTSVTDIHTGETRKFAVIDAAAYILDHVPLSSCECVSIVWILERIQKRGIRMGEEFTVNGQTFDFAPKDGKGRSVYPMDLVCSVIEAMVFSTVNDELKKRKYLALPSLQDPDTRRDMVWGFVEAVQRSGTFENFDMDISAYDTGFQMSILVTLVQRAIKPLFAVKWHKMVDLACFIMCYKCFMLRSKYTAMFPDLVKEAKSRTRVFEHGGYQFFFSNGSWLSGLKFTHVGGSLYGLVVIHGVIPRIIAQRLKLPPLKINYPVKGLQAGDDVLGASWKQIMNPSIPAEQAYAIYEEVCALLGLKFSWKKMWYEFVKDCKLVVFLQDLYHYATGIKGHGSAARFAVSWYATERDRHLPINEQEIIVTSKASQGWNSLYAKQIFKYVLGFTPFTTYVYSRYGSKGLAVLCGAVNTQADLEKLADKVGIDAYHWGVSKDEFTSLNFPVLNVLAEVAAGMEVSRETLTDEAISYLDRVEPDFSEFYREHAVTSSSPPAQQ